MHSLSTQINRLKCKDIFSYTDQAPQANANAFGDNYLINLFYKDNATYYNEDPWKSFTKISDPQGTITYYIDNVKDKQITKNIGESVGKNMYPQKKVGFFRDGIPQNLRECQVTWSYMAILQKK